MLWKAQPNGELEDKGHDETHSQSKHSIFNHIFDNYRHYQVLLQIHYERLYKFNSKIRSAPSNRSFLVFKLILYSKISKEFLNSKTESHVFNNMQLILQACVDVSPSHPGLQLG